jgi:hypothetical protein
MHARARCGASRSCLGRARCGAGPVSRLVRGPEWRLAVVQKEESCPNNCVSGRRRALQRIATVSSVTHVEMPLCDGLRIGGT